MGKLGIDPKMVIRATCKDYLATLPEEEANSYVDDMEQSVGEILSSKRSMKPKRGWKPLKHQAPTPSRHRLR
jgi:hypothetical protein